jgi:hypothetical protein
VSYQERLEGAMAAIARVAFEIATEHSGTKTIALSKDIHAVLLDLSYVRAGLIMMKLDG